MRNFELKIPVEWCCVLMPLVLLLTKHLGKCINASAI